MEKEARDGPFKKERFVKEKYFLYLYLLRW